MNTRKLTSIALAALLALGAMPGLADTVTLKVWGSQDNQALLGELVEEFKAANPGVEWDIALGVVSEADAQTRYSEDPAAAADIFAFANDQLRTLVSADSLSEIAGSRYEAVAAANTAGSVESATLDGTLYGFPMTADNGYFLYYDKSVFSAEDVLSLDKMLEVASAAGKKVFMDVSNGWYIASFFLGAGCVLDIGPDGKQVCDFNSPKGLAAAEAIRKFTADPAFLTGDDSVLQGGMGGSIAAGVSGTWNATAMQDKLGENYAAAPLPSFTCGGEQKHMASFIGTKLLGVNSLSANVKEAMLLAEHITGEAAQLRFFEQRALGPTNIAAAGNPAVLEDIALAALSAQSAWGVSQKNVLNGYWGPAEAFGLEMENKSTADLQGLLDQLVSQVTQ
ncbi:MAG: extracellular solute-binding protein [Oscillospiraceae bacterium]|jgi:arabinogalactan oligomer/maltooligosaccharide transport system substrate-binding protein|nr:extracellular solute-binding protein [Oscillospiraceae bacterium]